MKPCIILIIFAIGLSIRLYHLGVPSLWFDELSTAIRINHSFLETISLLRHSDFPPLHYAILNLWTSVVGNSEWALRFPSAIFSSLTIIVIYLLGKELFSKSVGLIAAALLAFSPFAINYAQDAKMYALFWFLTAGAFLFLFRFIKDQRKGSHRSYMLAATLSCYTMYTGFLFLVVQSMIFLLMGERSNRREWFCSQLIILVLCMPWLILFLCSKHVGFNLAPHDATFNFLTYFLNALMWIIGSSNDGLWSLNYFLYSFLIAYLLIDILTVAYSNKGSNVFLRSYYCLFIWLVFSVLFYFIFDYFVPAILHLRYMGFIQVPLILLVSSQVSRFQGVIIKKVLITILLAVSMHNTYLYFKDNLRYHQDWRKTATELSQEIGKNDVVLTFLGFPEFKYYYKGNTDRFFWLSKKSIKDCSAEFLIKKGILKDEVRFIFVLYTDYVPDIKLDGFILHRKVENGAIGFLHFQRIQSTNNLGGR